jgi:WXXGXW repeat (2 copies)
MKTRIGFLSYTLAALLFLGLPLASSSAYVAISVGIAPPAVPVYAQPLCPAPGYIWAPGYWAYGDFGYYWVPGAWVLPPQIGFLWTPGYWGYAGSTYIFHEGYWGPSVGFYGGINYGYGYYGSGYYGGRWVGSTFHYNTAVSRVNTNVIHNTYVNREVVRNATGTRASFNGDGGVQARPTAKEQAAAEARHVAPTSTQRSRVTAAKDDPALRAANNKGKPKVTAVKTFESKHGPKVTGTAAAGGPERATRKNGAAEEARAEKKTNASGHARSEKQASPEKANERVADRPSDRSHPSVKTAGKKEVASSQTRKATDTQHDQPHMVVSAPRADHHAPTTLYRPQAAAYPPQATKHQQAAENGKKKKKKKDKGTS